MKNINRSILFITIVLILDLIIKSNCWAQPIQEMPVPDTIIKEVRLALDGKEITFVTPPGINSNYRTMLSLANTAELFACQTSFVDNRQIDITKDDFYITMFIGTTNYSFNSLSGQTDAAPFINTNSDILIPLRTVADIFQYRISYEPSLNMVILQSPGFTGEAIPIDALPEPTPVPVPAPVQQPVQPPGNWGLLSAAPGLMPLAPNQTLISGYYTKLLNSPAARTNNIILSCAKINGKVLNPGELFSFNQTVGARTPEAGYQSAAIFAGKKVIQGIGGGICQTVSTIYNVVLEAGLSAVERHPHSLKVAYVAPGRDATVSWGSADFKFRNTYNFQVKILCKVEGDYVVVALVKEITTPESSSAN
ncbi:MAG: VanW family protein [Syntrophomonas sp.]